MALRPRVVDFDLFATEGGETRHLVVLSVEAQSGRHLRFQTDGAPSYTLIVCEESAESANPCGPQGPAPDRWSALPSNGPPSGGAE